MFCRRASTISITLLATKSIKIIDAISDVIAFSYQMTEAVKQDRITPTMFAKQLTLLEPDSNNFCYIDLDWSLHPELFKKTADNVQLNAVAHAITSVKEIYAKDFWVTEKQNPSLYAAQKILQLVRNALSHFKEKDGHISAVWIIRDEHDHRIFQVPEISLELDATNLNGREVYCSHFGGITNLLSLLYFLNDDLKKRFLS